MPDRAPSPPDRYQELVQAAVFLRDSAAVAGIVCSFVQSQVVPPLSPAAEGYTSLLLTPLISRSFAHAIVEMEAAAEAVDNIIQRYGI